MIEPLTSNTQAILLLTAPLVAGRGESSRDLLTLGEYNKLARILREKQKQPADLIGPDAAGCDQTLCAAFWPGAIGCPAGARIFAQSGGGAMECAGDLGDQPGRFSLPQAFEDTAQGRRCRRCFMAVVRLVCWRKAGWRSSVRGMWMMN